MYLCISCIFTYTYRVKLGNRCALKLEKATEVSFTRFFSCYLSSKVPYGQGCIKTQAYRSKFNSGVKMIKKSQHNDYLLKKLFVAHFFSIIVHQFFWLHKNYQMCAIIKNYIAHDLFNYCALILCISLYKRNLNEYSKTISNNQC